jgi:hypothetical protein
MLQSRCGRYVEEKIFTQPGLEFRPLSRVGRSQWLYRLRYCGSFLGVCSIFKNGEHEDFIYHGYTVCPQSPLGVLKSCVLRSTCVSLNVGVTIRAKLEVWIL